MKVSSFYMPVFVALGAVLIGAPGHADPPDVTLVIESHQFTPAELKVQAGEKFRLVIENRDATPEEFESHDLNREKIVPARGKIALFVGPLKPGRYEFFGEFNPKTARGFIVAE